ncbi:MAG: GNAT family N-acetyltransferase [Tractidigestivibacter sp.]|jgi:GNAT superfamily N-acetyltransferase|uniref:GNAT family N-acetyltransferase n=1 Tax=Tractidigestivibacter sp. TaxID=2847320 RepID=UPI003D90FF6A
MKLVKAHMADLGTVMDIINSAKEHLRSQGIDQWQNGYPDKVCIQGDIRSGKGYLVTDGKDVLGYLCIDFDGEPAYDALDGTWATTEPYVVVHRLAFAEAGRGKGLSDAVFRLVEDLSRKRGIASFRIDTDEANMAMRHILNKNGFTYRGTILFDNSTKIAFDKHIEGTVEKGPSSNG